ncbi:MAG TPA: efflux RND transporter periplasmic adaptor subunit [Polyangiaceae bacterium]|nr:efflux RND transporter periplasmic adaptor subunit [Polyangiaceae bacterium]
MSHSSEHHAEEQIVVRPAAGPKAWRWVGLAVALAISTGLVAAAAKFERPAPAESPPNNDVKVQGTTVSVAQSAPQWKVLELAPAIAATDSWTDPVPATVKVDETKAARVGSPLGGRVIKVFVELGQPVKAGDPLFSIASPQLADLSESEIRARVDLDAAKAAHDRIAALVDARALPAKEALNAERDLKSAEAAHRMASARLSALKVSSRSDNEFLVKSPRDGNVVEKNVLPGQEVGESSESVLMTIAELSSVWVVADLFESNANGIEIGTKVRVEVTSNPGRKIEGEVELVSAVVDPERHTVPVRVRLDNTTASLKPNTFARMEFLAKPPAGTVEISASALVSDGEDQYVYVQGQDQSFGRRSVTAGSVHQGKIPIYSGLKAGDVVVQNGGVLLDNQIQLAQ